MANELKPNHIENDGNCKLAILQIRRPTDLDDPICQQCTKHNAKYGNEPDYINEDPITDFAAARNLLQKDALMDNPEIEWFLWLDVDEVFPYKIEFQWIEDPHEGGLMIHIGSVNQFHVGIPSAWFHPMSIGLPRYNLFLDQEHYRIDSGCYPDIQQRIVHKTGLWINKIHETVKHKSHTCHSNIAHIYHYSYFRDPSFQESKHARFHQLSGNPSVWTFPKLTEVSLKKLPDNAVMKLD